MSKSDVDEAQLKMIGDRFAPLVRRRWMLSPVLAVLVVLMLIDDHAPWRLWFVGGTLAALALRAVFERRHPDEPLALFASYGAASPGRGFRPRLVARDASIALAFALPILASGGFDSPVLPLIGPVTFFVGAIAATRTLVVFALTYAGMVAGLAFVSAHGLVSDLLPAVFGGGPGVPRSQALLYSRAAGIVVALGYAAGLSHLVRQVFQQMIGDALDSRDEVLRAHDAHARELTTLSGELAHELKNPLANVKGLAVLVGRDVEGRGRERLEILQHEVGRMEEILHGFLTFSRPLSPLDEEEVDMNYLCESVLALHEGIAQSRNVSLRSSAAAPVHASCDQQKVKQILINLVQNALDASPSGAAVELALLAPAGGGARMEVRDRGPGISPAVRAHLFEPGSTTKERGTGLGLALARGLARQHGGELSLEDREGGGCIATLTIPAKRGQPAGEAA